MITTARTSSYACFQNVAVVGAALITIVAPRPVPEFIVQTPHQATHMQNISIESNRSLRLSVDRLAKETANPDWDLEGGRAIPTSEWNRAAAFSLFVAGVVPSAPAPFVSPCGDGTIHMEWSRADKRRVVLELRGGDMWWSSRSADGAYDNGTCADSVEAVEIIRRLVA